MSKILSFNLTYDPGADVLYITKRKETAVKGIEDEYGIVWRYSEEGDIISATILDFRELWEHNQLRLANELSRGFGIPNRQAETVIQYALESQERRH